MPSTITVVKRPMQVTFTATGASYPLSSEEAQRLVDEYPTVKATAYRVDLRADDGFVCSIYPATIGGGIAFELTG